MSEPTICTVRPLSRNSYLIVPRTGYEITMFRRADHSAEAVISSASGHETVRLNVEKPSEGQALKFVLNQDGSVEVIYATQ